MSNFITLQICPLPVHKNNVYLLHESISFKNGEKQDSRRRSVQKREHEIVQGYKYIYGFWKNYLSNSLEIQLKTCTMYL